MMDDPLLSLTQVFQLMGLAQCLLLLAYLAGCGGEAKRRLLAGSFFLVLAAGLGLPYWPQDWSKAIPGVLAAIGAALPAFSYLLADQMLEARLPSPRQFLVLLVPLVGAWLVFAGDIAPESNVCLGELCSDADSAARLWQVFSGGVLLMAIMGLVELRCRSGISLPQEKERRGLAVGLVIVNLAALGAILAQLFGVLAMAEAEFTLIALGLGFIYLATSMMFRIFPESAQFSRHSADETAGDASPAKREAHQGLDGEDLELLERIRRYLEAEQPHLKEDFHRQDMALDLGVPEHRLSKVVNQGFGKSLIDVLNELRVDEAKRLLLSSDEQVTQIAFSSGFNALPSFHRVFKKHAGCSPSEWREKNGGIVEKSTLKS